MTQAPRPPLGLDDEAPLDGNPTPPGPIPVTERPTPSGRRRRAEPAPDLPPLKAERPWLFQPGVFYALGALLFGLTWLSHLNPYAPALDGHAVWPWQLFRERMAAGGPPTFAWSLPHAVAIVFAVAALAYLIAAILRPSHGRGAFALLVTLLPVVLFWPEAGGPIWYASGIAAAVVVGAVLLRYDRRRLARGTLFVGTVLVGAMLFFPAPEAAAGAYVARITGLVAPFVDRLPLDAGRLLTGDGVHVMLLLLLAVLGVLAAFGLRTKWVKVAAVVALVLLVLLPPTAVQVGVLDDARPEGLDLLAVLNQPPWLWTLGLALVFVAGLASWLGLGGRWATWVAGTALLLLTFDHAASVFREAASAPDVTDGLQAGAVAVGRQLAHGTLAASLLPVAAVVMDLARPRI